MERQHQQPWPRLTPRAAAPGAAKASEARWTAVAAAVLVALIALDLSLPSANISGALVVAPFLASGGVPPRRVGVVGAMAVLAAVGLAFADSSSVPASAARISVLVVGTLVAAQAASLRSRRQQALLELSMVANAAQGAIIRKPAPRVGSVAVATWYQSSVRAATVGGDCFEILATPYGTRAIVGDVRGHGMPSVRLAALVLGAFRALAFTEVDLAGVARGLDRLVAHYAQDTADNDIDGEEFVTAVLCELAGSSMTLANCGHPPPLLVLPNGQVRRLDAAVPTFPLGIGSVPVLDIVEVPVAARVLLYTDGLVETADRWGAYFDLEAAASGLARTTLAAGVATVIEKLNAFADGHVDDDVALMLLEPIGLPAPSSDVGAPM